MYFYFYNVVTGHFQVNFYLYTYVNYSVLMKNDFVKIHRGYTPPPYFPRGGGNGLPPWNRQVTMHIRLFSSFFLII